MLHTLRIKNLALVEDLTIEFFPGLNVITGETGAGKSMIIGALKLVLGERADRTAIRAGADQCSVEAVFALPALASSLCPWLEAQGLEPMDGNQLLVKRQFNAQGVNRQFINGSPTTAHILTELGSWLVDLHGPHDHQSLIHPAQQRALLDAYGRLDSMVEEFGQRVRERQALQGETQALGVDDATYARQLEWLQFQVAEIEGARLREGEEEELSAEFQRANNAARLGQICESIRQDLSEGEPSLFALAGAIGRHLVELERLDPGVANWTAAHGRALEQWHELQSEVSRYAERIDVDAGRLREMEERLDLLHALRRKYGGSVADVIRFGQKAREEWERLQGREGELERLKRELLRVDERLNQLGRDLTARRVKAAAKLGEAVRRQLAELGFNRSQFSVAVDTTLPETMASVPSAGFDQVEFQFAPNVGEPARPLRAIASSGEMARVMLALKTALAGQDKVPVLVFDEIDANVGGTTARTVGEKMRQIARQHQVLCITHLAPVAAAATTHFLVSKAVRQSRTWSEIRPLPEDERVAEVARMLGGVDAAARQHAEALLLQARSQAPA